MKWIFAFIGFSIYRFPGAIFGFFIGTLAEQFYGAKSPTSLFGNRSQQFTPRDFELHLQSLYHEGLLYRFDIPSDLDFIFQEKNAKSKIQAYSSKINIELKDIITDLLHPIVWAFKQSHDSIQRDNVLHNVEDLLKRNRFIE